MRNRAERRHYNYYKSKRKYDIARSWGWNEIQGKFVKGKLHCSCPMCSRKTARLGNKISEIKKPQFYEDDFDF